MFVSQEGFKTSKIGQLEYKVDVLQQTDYFVHVINAHIKLKQVLAEHNSRNNSEKDITGLKQLQKTNQSWFFKTKPPISK